MCAVCAARVSPSQPGPDNIQVVNAFNDGRHKYVRDWLKHTDRDVASLEWSLAEERQRRGFGGLVAIHIEAHAEDRFLWTPAQVEQP